jgi:hypothetical protein
VRPAGVGHVTVYASWNGATEVARWRVSGDGVVLATVPRTGFETAIRVGSQARLFTVDALDAAGDVIGASPAAAARR